MTKKILLAILIVVTSFQTFAQSKTTNALQEKFGEAFSAFFYHNTLRMLNQKEDPEFDALIKDIEKIKFLMIDKAAKSFSYPAIVGDYKKEAFEEAMTSRHQGKSFDVFIKENNGKTKGMLVLINDETTFYVLDIVGSIALNKITKLYSTLEESSDIGRRIKEFTKDGEDNNDEEDKSDNR